MAKFYFWLLVGGCTMTLHAATANAQPGQRGADSGTAIQPEDLPFELGVATIPDRGTYEKLSFQGDAGRDAYLNDLEFVKFIVVKAATKDAQIYWINTQNTQAHPRFMGAIGLGGMRGRRGGGGGNSDAGGTLMRGALTFLPRLTSPDGTAGLYIFDFQPNDRFSIEALKSAQDMIFKTMPYVKGKVAYHAFREDDYTSQKEEFANAGIVVHLDKDIWGDIGYLPLNEATSFGRLRVMDNETRPSPRDIVICKTLPNQMPRVAGVISEVRQTPLSHVNLRAVQDKVPNAFIINATQTDGIVKLIGKPVRYQVTSQGYKLREATSAEMNEHFTSLRPNQPQVLKRDLTKQEILPLEQIRFTDSASFGSKSSNLAAMHLFEFPAGTIPDGVAVPFFFYDEFMKHNSFYDVIEKLLSRSDFQQSREVQEQELKRFRTQIKQGKMPEWMTAALTKTQATLSESTSIRCRSSTNNEDLPGFSGAGLYDSYTHHPQEGHLSKSIKQVYASLWNFRAFEEREFYRIEHLQTAMGVLLHSNFHGEQANGVAVTDDILYETYGNYYLNTQSGEDLVTNPNEASSPEEILLSWYKEDGHQIVRHSATNKQLLSNAQLDELRDRLARVHGRFRKLYGKSKDDVFAMEIEFKITRDGKLSIKQARPWVF